jgi:hypothetical protein
MLDLSLPLLLYLKALADLLYDSHGDWGVMTKGAGAGLASTRGEASPTETGLSCACP